MNHILHGYTHKTNVYLYIILWNKHAAQQGLRGGEPTAQISKPKSLAPLLLQDRVTKRSSQSVQVSLRSGKSKMFHSNVCKFILSFNLFDLLIISLLKFLTDVY